MKILCACEESQAVTIQLRKLGHEAYSCDIQDCSGGHPECHIKGDVIPLFAFELKKQKLCARFRIEHFEQLLTVGRIG